MEPARPRTDRRRPRRGSADRPVDTRLLRNLWLVVALPLLLLLATVARTGPYPATTLPASFDRATAVALTRTLALEHADRVPGSAGAEKAAAWFVDSIHQYGLGVEEDVWHESVPTLGNVTLRNLAVVIPGSQEQVILVVAHRDNIAGTAGANDNASGTAALIELARSFATVGSGDAEPRRPLHTIVLLSSDAGDYGGRGVLRFARRSPLRGRIGAAIVLDGIAGTQPRLEVGGLGQTSPTLALVRTLSARVAEATSRDVERPSVIRQLVTLATPFATGEQAVLLGEGIPAVRLTTTADARPRPGADEVEGINPLRLGQLGAGVDRTLTALDAAVELPRTTSSLIFIGNRAIRGWALEIVLLAATLPFFAAMIDLAVRCRRRGIPLRPAWEALRRRLLAWLASGLALLAAAVLGVFPTGSALPPTPYDPPAQRWAAVTVVAALVVIAAVWLSAPRNRAREATDEERLAGWAVALLGLGVVAAIAVAVSPLALLVLLPSLYAWLLVPHAPGDRGWLTDALFGLGFAGPAIVVASLALQLDLGLKAPVFVLQLVTAGTIPFLGTLATIGWVAVATHIGSLLAGSYVPPDDQSSRR